MTWAPPASAMSALRDGLSRALAPPGPCPVCQGWCRGGLCTTCRQRFALTDVPRCPRCALRVGTPQALCGRCLVQPPPMAITRAAVDYEFPWQGLIQSWKFRQTLEHSRALAELLLTAITAPSSAHAAADLVVPVPLSPQRLRERGYNQAWELARRVARWQRLRADAGLLQRCRDTPSQAGLTATDRARNLVDAFRVAADQHAALQGRSVALVDDVMTTGATVSAASRALLAAGAAQVQVWVLARTPLTDAD